MKMVPATRMSNAHLRSEITRLLRFLGDESIVLPETLAGWKTRLAELEAEFGRRVEAQLGL